MKKTKKLKDETLAELGRMLAEMRKAKGISQEEFCEKINVNAKYYSEIERGVRNISFKLLEQILQRGHDIRPTTLFFGSTEKDSQKVENARLISLFHEFLRKSRKRDRTGAEAYLKGYLGKL